MKTKKLTAILGLGLAGLVGLSDCDSRPRQISGVNWRSNMVDTSITNGNWPEDDYPASYPPVWASGKSQKGIFLYIDNDSLGNPTAYFLKGPNDKHAYEGPIYTTDIRVAEGLQRKYPSLKDKRVIIVDKEK